jgi:hypothetical protein
LRKLTGENRQHSKITEACVQDLVLSMTDQNGEQRKSLRLRWGLVNFPTIFVVDFFIVSTGDYEISTKYMHVACSSGPVIQECIEKEQEKLPL